MRKREQREILDECKNTTTRTDQLTTILGEEVKKMS
jgi:hypothetical protein